MDFLLPAAFWGFAALPALIAIYFFRRQLNKKIVSSIFLWRESFQELEVGRTFESFKPSVLFFLELLTIVSIIIAASRPVLTKLIEARELFVVLDNSYSMLAGSDNSPRLKGLVEISNEINRRKGLPVTFILAGSIPEIIGRSITEYTEALSILERWKCNNASSDLERAMILAIDLARGRGDVLIISDHPPKEWVVLPPGVKWKSLGLPLANVAITSAYRISKKRSDTVRCEIKNFSETSCEKEISVTVGKENKEIKREKVAFAPFATHRMIFDVSSHLSPVQILVSSDALDIDNRVFLVKSPNNQIKVNVDISKEEWKSFFERGIIAPGIGILATNSADLVITDRLEITEKPARWILRVFSDKDALPLIGPFILNHNHPLTQGLSLKGIVWGASQSKALAGKLVISAGSTVLLSEESKSPYQILNLNLNLDLSTIQHSPDWPIFFDNLLRWRQADLPGWVTQNVRLGNRAVLKTNNEKIDIKLTLIGSDSVNYTINEGFFDFFPTEVGLYEANVAGEIYQLAVNTLNSLEADLTLCQSGEWGSWAHKEDSVSKMFKNLSWLFLLAALIFLGIHHSLLVMQVRKMPA